MGKIADATRGWTIGIEQRRQLLAFDTELEEANGKVRRLEAKVLDLEKKVEPLEREVERLKKQVEEDKVKAERAEKLAAFKSNKAAQTEANVNNKHDLEPDAEQILVLFARKEELLSSLEIQQELGMATARAEYYIREMLRSGHLEEARVDELGNMLYAPGHEGNTFLVKKGHV